MGCASLDVLGAAFEFAVAVAFAAGLDAAAFALMFAMTACSLDIAAEEDMVVILSRRILPYRPLFIVVGACCIWL